MPVFKVNARRNGPKDIFTKEEYLVHMPKMEKFVNDPKYQVVFETYKNMAWSKVFKSVWGDEWGYAMSLCIAHYLVLYSRRAGSNKGLGDSLAGVAMMGNNDGLLTSWSVGEVSKSYDYSSVMLNEGTDSAFWNLTGFGREYYSLWTQKQPITIGVVI